MALFTPTNLLAGESGGPKDVGLGTLAGLAMKFSKAPLGVVSAALVSIAVLSAEKEANETCASLIYGQ